MFNPVTKRTLVDGITRNLLEMIAKGELRPGAALPSERELAASFHVSRVSVREALKALAARDVVVIKPGSGTYLSENALGPNSPFFSDADDILEKYRSDYRQILEARSVLEVETAAFAARRITDGELGELERSLGRMKDLLEREEYSAYTMEDLSFHDKIASGCHNDYLYMLYNQIFPSIVDISRLGETVPDRHWPSYRQHITIFSDLRSRDEEAVRRDMERHVTYCGENVNMFFQKIKQLKAQRAAAQTPQSASLSLLADTLRHLPGGGLGLETE